MANNNKVGNNKNKQSFEDSAAPRKKARLILMVLILGLAVLVSLYIHFQTSYQSPDDSIREQKTPSSQTMIANLTQKKLPSEQQTPSTFLSPIVTSQQNEQPTTPESSSNQNQSISPCKSLQPCSNLLQFIQEYILLKNAVNNGEDISNQINNLNKFSINSDPLKQNIVDLLKYSRSNRNYKYFQDKFKTLIKPIYKNSKYFFTIDLKDYILIRKIDDRALQNEDLDKTVFLISQSLDNNNLLYAHENLEKLPSDLNLINIFKQEIQDQINIETSTNNIENILLNNSDCAIVSK